MSAGLNKFCLFVFVFENQKKIQQFMKVGPREERDAQVSSIVCYALSN